MDNALLLSFAGIALLIACSAFFAGSETALTAVSRGKMLRLEQNGSRAARNVNKLANDRERMIGALLLGNTFINILASALATAIFEPRLGEHAVVIVTAFMTVFVLVFAEVMPKTLAIARTDRVALAVAGPVRLFILLLGPVIGTVQFLVWRMLNVFGLREDTEPVLTAQEEIRGAIDLHHQEGTVEREHRDMLGGILDLSELRIADVIVHRRNMDILDGGASSEEIVARVLSSPHTRFPIWRGDPENIVGVLHAKDLLRDLMQRKGSLEGFDAMALASEPWFVPDATTLQEQLAAFRVRREHFALVVDEYGVLQGLVTLEDILEEIFGDIADEPAGLVPDGIRPQPDGSYNVDGWTPLRDLNRELDWNLPDEEANTIAGLVIHEARIIPDVGQAFSFHGYKFEILRRQRNQITALRIIPPRPLARDEDDSG
jgi:Mg2+/Co2+ transporter CorB